jgi:hypothetical protein
MNRRFTTDTPHTVPLVVNVSPVVVAGMRQVRGVNWGSVVSLAIHTKLKMLRQKGPPRSRRRVQRSASFLLGVVRRSHVRRRRIAWPLTRRLRRLSSGRCRRIGRGVAELGALTW